jgi:hypothetical protein
VTFSFLFFACPLVAAAGYLYVTGLERASGWTYGAPVLVALLSGGIVEGSRLAGMQDVEVWNGFIASKTHGSMGCCHCREECDTCTRTDSNGRSETYRCHCHEVCDHPRDYRWDLHVTTGDDITVKQCESRESAEPPAWTKAYVGEPASVEHPYTNYLLADPDSVYQQAGNVAVSLPATTYPRVTGFYHVDHVVGAWPAAVKPTLEDAMDAANASLGSRKQVNVLLYGYTGPASATDAAQALTKAWTYGKKNDLIVVVQHDGTGVLSADVVTISKVGELRSRVQHELTGAFLDELPEKVNDLVERYFTRTPMAEWSYLESQAQPPAWALLLAVLVEGCGAILYVAQDAFRARLPFSRFY